MDTTIVTEFNFLGLDISTKPCIMKSKYFEKQSIWFIRRLTMSQSKDLKEAEKKVFRTAYNDGLWDILLGCFFLMFTFAPYLSTVMGDFWSSAVFLPFWGIVYLCIRLIRAHVISPRIGVVEFGKQRKWKLKKFSVVMLVVNTVIFLLGLIAAFTIGRVPGQLYTYLLGSFFLVGFSLAAYSLDIVRLYIYGLLAGLATVGGEWLYINWGFSHHGFPVAFGTTAGIMILVGLVLFFRLLIKYPPQSMGSSSKAESDA
jgi:hypothetical protein